MIERNYVPTIAELLDRLSILLLKTIYISKNKKAYRREIELIKSDILASSYEHGEMYRISPDVIEMCMVLMLANRVIWENESKAREGGSEQDHLLKYTHSINGVRNTAKNRISEWFGERVDLKVDCLAADLPESLGNWNVFDD